MSDERPIDLNEERKWREREAKYGQAAFAVSDQAPEEEQREEEKSE